MACRPARLLTAALLAASVPSLAHRDDRKLQHRASLLEVGSGTPEPMKWKKSLKFVDRKSTGDTILHYELMTGEPGTAKHEFSTPFSITIKNDQTYLYGFEVFYVSEVTNNEQNRLLDRELRILCAYSTGWTEDRSFRPLTDEGQTPVNQHDKKKEMIEQMQTTLMDPKKIGCARARKLIRNNDGQLIDDDVALRVRVCLERGLDLAQKDKDELDSGLAQKDKDELDSGPFYLAFRGDFWNLDKMWNTGAVTDNPQYFVPQLNGVIETVLMVLKRAAERGQIHGSISPFSIYTDATLDGIQVGDWEWPLPSPGTRPAKFAYFEPEERLDEKHPFAYDMWSIGNVIMWMLTTRTMPQIFEDEMLLDIYGGMAPYDDMKRRLSTFDDVMTDFAKARAHQKYVYNPALYGEKGNLELLTNQKLSPSACRDLLMSFWKTQYENVDEPAAKDYVLKWLGSQKRALKFQSLKEESYKIDNFMSYIMKLLDPDYARRDQMARDLYAGKIDIKCFTLRTKEDETGC